MAVCALVAIAACGRAAADEAERIAAMLQIEAGLQVADVGAGEGRWAFDLARRVGPEGQVFATEVDADDVEELRRKAQRRSIDNLTVVVGDQQRSGLPALCCDALLLRMVYHHFVDPAAMRRELWRALRPGALMLVIDIEPQTGWRSLPGVPDRGGHGIPSGELAEELAGAGFELVAHRSRWNGEADRYATLFRRPPAKDRE